MFQFSQNIDRGKERKKRKKEKFRPQDNSTFDVNARWASRLFVKELLVILNGSETNINAQIYFCWFIRSVVGRLELLCVGVAGCSLLLVVLRERCEMSSRASLESRSPPIRGLYFDRRRRRHLSSSVGRMIVVGSENKHEYFLKFKQQKYLFFCYLCIIVSLRVFLLIS